MPGASTLALAVALTGLAGASDFADSLAVCSAVRELNLCLREVGRHTTLSPHRVLARPPPHIRPLENQLSFMYFP
jgi:hypothetical protein